MQWSFLRVERMEQEVAKMESQQQMAGTEEKKAASGERVVTVIEEMLKYAVGTLETPRKLVELERFVKAATLQERHCQIEVRTNSFFGHSNRMKKTQFLWNIALF